MGSKWWQVTVAAVVASVTVGVASPGSAAGQPGGALRTYCAELERIGQEFGPDPGIDAIFEGNPDPTLADWAAFLPGPIAKMHQFLADIESLDAPAQAARAAKVAVRRWESVVDFYEAGRRAAAAGDQKTFDSVGERRVPLLKKLGKAMTKLGKRCGFETDGGA